jgi:hypothetical protein
MATTSVLRDDVMRYPNGRVSAACLSSAECRYGRLEYVLTGKFGRLRVCEPHSCTVSTCVSAETVRVQLYGRTADPGSTPGQCIGHECFLFTKLRFRGWFHIYKYTRLLGSVWEGVCVRVRSASR